MQATALSPRSLRLPPRLLRAAPDERLVAALRRGDEKAFEAIYDRHHRALLGFCRHMLGSHEEAEDALQRVFVAAHRHLSDGTAHVNLKPWLYTIARNRCLSMLRARRETLALDDVREPSGDGLALADEVELGEDLKDLLGDIARLPDDQRAALVLAELGDLSQQEIATILDVRTDKVKALIFQAREALAGWRQARAASCGEICEQLSTLKGSALRRAPIRRHLAVCPACTAFEAEVKRQRVALSLLLPVVPSAALKHSVLTATLSAGAGCRGGGRGRRRRGGYRRRRRVRCRRQGAGGRRDRGQRRRGRRRRGARDRAAPAGRPARGDDARARGGARGRCRGSACGRPSPSRRAGRHVPARRGVRLPEPEARTRSSPFQGGQGSRRQRAARGGALRARSSARGGTQRARAAAGGGSKAGPHREGPPGARQRRCTRPPPSPPASKRKATPPAAAHGKSG